MSASAAAAAAAAAAGDMGVEPYPGINGLDQRKHIDPMNNFLRLLNMRLERIGAGAGAGAVTLHLLSNGDEGFTTEGIVFNRKIKGRTAPIDLADKIARLLWPKLKNMDKILSKLAQAGMGELTQADIDLHAAIANIVKTLDAPEFMGDDSGVPGIDSAKFKNSFEKLALTLTELQARVLLRECPEPVPCVHPDPEECICPDPKPIVEGVVRAIDAVSDKVGQLSQTVENIDAKADKEAADAAAAAAAAAATAASRNGKGEDDESGEPAGAAGTGRGIDRYKSASPVRGIQDAEEAVDIAQDALAKASEGRDRDVARKVLRGAKMTLYDLQRKAAAIDGNNAEADRLVAEIERLRQEQQQEEQKGGYHYKYIKYKTKYNALREAMQSA